MTKHILTGVIFLLISISVFAQNVKNIRVVQDGNRVNVQYDLTGQEENYNVDLFVTFDEGKTWQGPLIQVAGNVGEKQAVGTNKQIEWNVLAEVEKIQSYIQFKVVATNKFIFTDSRDGHKYKTIKIGNLIWMTENLAFLPDVSPSTVKSNTESYYYVYGYNGTSVSAAKATNNYGTYGVLYNWPAAKTACPSGWHLPTDAEWTELENALTGADKGSQLAGNTSLWSNGKLKNSSQFGTSGFSGLPGGYRGRNGSFDSITNYGTWWSATENSTSHAWRRYLDYSYTFVYRYSYNKEYGFSVRCVKD